MLYKITVVIKNIEQAQIIKIPNNKVFIKNNGRVVIQIIVKITNVIYKYFIKACVRVGIKSKIWNFD